MYEELAKRCPTVLPHDPVCGFYCPKGWETIVTDLFVQIEVIARSLKDPPVCDQVKSKFGGLRIYMSSHNDEIENLIRDAEAICYASCEVCGERATQHTAGGWVRTECDAHRRDNGTA